MAELSDSFLGKRIREYEILQVIGRGGMGAVYRARHIYLDEERAIKVIESDWAQDEDFINRFIREARVLTKLRHPNLVELFEFGTLENNIFFMVLELLKGESVLARVQRQKRIPVPDAIKVIREAALGLQLAHDKDIVHRDISPDNMLLVRNHDGIEITKVIDFGIAKPRFESGQRLTVANLFIGKPQFCSPEQCGILSEDERIDGRSDIYSLAICFYYMVTGKLPFYSPTLQGYLPKHISQAPKPIFSHFGPGEFPESLGSLIMKSLSKNRNDRPSSMKEFADALISTSSSHSVPIARVELKTEMAFSGLRPGDLFARRYRVEKMVGIGRIGSVYKAVDKILEVPIALKILSLEIANDLRILERFKREVIHARRITHPNVCRTFDIGEAAGTHYVSMEFLEGKTLARMVKDQGPLSIEIGMPIIRQVLDALKEAHRVGVIHRDLKPQNIMVDDKFRACIMDFGISVSPGARTLTPAGTTVGNPDYMAPELFENKTIDHRADIYSIGIMLYELFTGRHPFASLSAVEMVAAHLERIPPKPSSIVSTILPSLENIILRALQKDPAKRFQSVEDLRHALQPFGESSKGIDPGDQQYLANKLLAERNFTQAIQYLRSLISKDPENLQWKKLFRLATSEKAKEDLRRVKILIRKGDYRQAQLRLEKIRNLEPDTRTLDQIGKLELALKQLTQHPQIVPVEPVPEMDRTESPVLLEQGVKDEVSRVPEETAPGPEPASAAVHQQPKREITRKQDKSEIAMQLFRTGRIFFDQRRFQEALESFEGALKLLPQNEELLEWIQSAQTALHQKEDHTESSALATGKGRRDAEYNRFVKQGVLHFEAKRWQDALKCFLIAQQIYDADPDLKNYIRAVVAKQRKLPGMRNDRQNDTSPEGTSSRLLFLIPVFSVVVVILFTGAWLAWRYLHNPGTSLVSEKSSPDPATPAPVNAVKIATTNHVDVAVNVLPWALVKIRPLKKNVPQSDVIAERLTPFSLELEEGEYVLECSNQAFHSSVQEMIRVEPQKRNVFLFTLSHYDPDQSLERVLTIR